MQSYIGKNLFQASSCHQSEYSTGRKHFSFHNTAGCGKKTKNKKGKLLENPVVRKFIEYYLVLKKFTIYNVPFKR